MDKQLNSLSALTPFSEVNVTLNHFSAWLNTLLGSHFIGMYVVGSLALGDFNPDTSDIDFIVVMDEPPDDELIDALWLMHADFDSSASPWIERIEAIYITPDAFDLNLPNGKSYPQVEKGVKLFTAPLEEGWVFQCYSLREYGIVVSGVDPHTLITPIDRKYIPPAVAAITGMWLDQAANDPRWIDWLREVPSQQFVILTVCRLLYSLVTGDVCSKLAAARWAISNLPQPWVDLVVSSLANSSSNGEISEGFVTNTISFIQYTFELSTSK